MLGSHTHGGYFGSAYPSSKAALNHFAKCVALQEAYNGVRINVISPGAVLTPMTVDGLVGPLYGAGNLAIRYMRVCFLKLF